MAVTLKQTEAEPVTFPTVTGLSEAAAALDALALWQRIEAYTSRRWTARNVVWIVEADGGDLWEPPLSPVVTAAGECWNEDALDWETVEMIPSPTGYVMTYAATYRITATVGAGDLPAAVAGAFRRLAEYLTDTSDRSGASNYSVNMGGAIEESYDRNPAWMARALDLSGAADLLRPYRRA